MTCQKSHHEIVIHYRGGGGGLTITVDLIWFSQQLSASFMSILQKKKLRLKVL